MKLKDGREAVMCYGTDIETNCIRKMSDGSIEIIGTLALHDKLYENDYLAFFEDGTIGFTDGCAYMGEMTKKEVKELYVILKGHFE